MLFYGSIIIKAVDAEKVEKPIYMCYYFNTNDKSQSKYKYTVTVQAYWLPEDALPGGPNDTPENRRLSRITTRQFTTTSP